ncbi:MAG: ABC transporter ATP-binding protein [Candidatus Binatia bacterium]
MQLLIRFARRYPWHTAVMLICLLLGGLAAGVGLSSLLPLIGLAANRSGARTGGGTHGGGSPNALEQAVTRALQVVGLQPTTGVLLAVIVTGMTVKAGLVLLANKQVGYTVAQVATDLRLALIRALLRTRWEYYVHQPVGAFANAVASEARRASEAYLHATMILSLLVEAVVYACVAFLVSWRATLVALVAGAVIVYAFNRLVHVTRRAGTRQTRLTKSLLGRLTDTLQGVKPLKAMARETLIGPLLESETRRLNRALQREVLSKEALRALQEPLIVAFLAAGLYVALTRSTLPLATVIMLALLCAQIVAGLGKVQKEVQRMGACESAFWSLNAMIEQAEAAHEVKPGRTPPVLQREVVLQHASFAYEQRWVLRDACLRVPAGRLTVLVGPSGAGKTTVADLLIGLIEPQAGDVFIDDVSLRILDARLWRAMIGYVPQETFLLHDSVRLNVTLGDPDLTAADVEAALRAAGAWEFVTALPEGPDTMVGERGLRISGGQRQRIALARALARRPRLLILDEATTGLDPATEEGICATLLELRGTMTILAICHQGRLIDIADHVYHVGDGRITPLAPLDEKGATSQAAGGMQPAAAGTSGPELRAGAARGAAPRKWVKGL